LAFVFVSHSSSELSQCEDDAVKLEPFVAVVNVVEAENCVSSGNFITQIWVGIVQLVIWNSFVASNLKKVTLRYYNVLKCDKVGTVHKTVKQYFFFTE